MVWVKFYGSLCSMIKRALPDIQLVSVNHRASWEDAISEHFWKFFKRRPFRHLLLSLLTFGVFPYKKYKLAKRDVAQAIAKRKLLYFRSLHESIERSRMKQSHFDPRQSINAVFMAVQSEKVSEAEEALEFKAIYTPSELLLFITNPTSERVHVYKRRTQQELNYLKCWHEIKKKAHINQYRQIQNINYCSQILKEEYYLTREGIHDRLSRTSVSRRGSYFLSKLRELGKAFQEVLVAYHEFDELKVSSEELYKTIEMLSKTSKQDIESLQTFLSSCYLPKDLPMASRRQVIQIANQQEILFRMSEEQQFTLCALILDRHQWEFLLSLQKVSELTLSLLDWAFEESSSSIHGELSFLDRIARGASHTIQEDQKAFPLLLEKAALDPSLQKMTLDFAKELNREWPSLHLYVGEELIFHLENTSAFSIEHLLETYHAIETLTPNDPYLFSLLQQALSQEGKQAFQSAIEEGVFKLLGEKSHYFLPILSNSDITLIQNC